MIKTFKLLTFLLSLSAIWSAHGADTPLQGFEPNQIERQIENRPARQSTAPPFAGEAAKTQIDLKDQTLVLAGVLIEGATVYRSEDFLPFYQHHLGERVSVATLREIAEAITRHYQNNGYFLSNAFLPAQDIEFGIVRIRVIEGYVANWSVQGSTGKTDKLIARILAPVMTQRPTRKPTLSATLMQINALPGLIVRPQIHRISGQLGGYELLLPIKKSRFDGSYNIDNRGTEFIGPVQNVITLRIYDMVQDYDTYQLKFATTTETRELTYLDTSAEWLLGTDRLHLVASATTLSANPGGRLESLDAEIISDRYKLGLDYSMLHTETLQRSVGTDIHRYYSSTRLAGTKRLEDKLTSLSVNYRQVMLDSRGDTHFLSAAFTFGLPLGGNKVIDTQSSAGVGDPEFSKINISYSGNYPLKRRWDLAILLDGQLAYDALPSSERYSIGGPRFGSAYDPSEIIGDHGLASRFEISRRDMLTVQNWHITPYAFYDIATVWQYEQEAKDARETAASAGLGLHTIASYIAASIEFAKPLTRSVASEGEDGKDVRVFGNLNIRF